MVKILHSADFHLDTRFESLPREKAAEQRREQRRLLFEMAELVKGEGVQLVLLSGDLLDSDLSYYETHEALSGALEEMAVPVFIAPGNHDYY
ncbi:MAG: metallophosphoesterase, partial [Oscillospiraceae bacterium]|nr:metallophosphoesterase [Oscillospiraceae bacterium]